MTEKIFWSEPYRSELSTVISGVEGQVITLEKTIFFAFSGGQESDEGSIGGIEVISAEAVGKDIFYTLSEGHGLEVGQPVVVAIDWPRRYRLMRLHFAAELVLELVMKHMQPVEKIGAHIAASKARIDVLREQSITGELPRIQEMAQAVIDADHPIVSAFSRETEQLRYWEISGFARVPCGGTHLRSTGEVGTLSLARKNPGRGKERINIFVSNMEPPYPVNNRQGDLVDSP